MDYYDLTDEQQTKMQVDYDFCACLEYNPQPFNLIDVEKVLAVIEGENDEKDWHWVVLLKDKRVLYLVGGCDYTGWDCQSSAFTTFLDLDMTLLKATKNEDISKELHQQITTQKDTTWRERKDKEFGL